MAVYKRDIIDINLETGNIYRSWLKHSIGMKDQKADHFGVRVFRNGEAVSLTGVSVQGVFMPPEGSPIAITSGNIVSGNVAEVVLPQACYNYDGQFTLAIKLVDSTNSVTGTVRIVDGMVDNTHASGTVAPTSAVPTYQEVLSVYEQAITVIGKSVRFDTDQSLTDAQKTTARTNIAAASTGELSDLKSAIAQDAGIIGNIIDGEKVDLLKEIEWEVGAFNTAGQPNTGYTTRLRTINYIDVRYISSFVAHIDTGYKYKLYWYANDYVFKSTEGWQIKTGMRVSIPSGAIYLKLLVADLNDGDVTESYSEKVSFVADNVIYELIENDANISDGIRKGEMTFSYEWEQGGLGNSTGSEYDTPNVIRTNFMDVLFCSVIEAELSSGSALQYWKIFEYDKAKTFIKNTNFSKSTLTGEITLDNNTAFIRIQFENWDAQLTVSDGSVLTYVHGLYYQDGAVKEINNENIIQIIKNQTNYKKAFFRQKYKSGSTYESVTIDSLILAPGKSYILTCGAIDNAPNASTMLRVYIKYSDDSVDRFDLKIGETKATFTVNASKTISTASLLGIATNSTATVSAGEVIYKNIILFEGGLLELKDGIDLDNHIPEYYKSHLAIKEATIRSNEDDCSFAGDSFVFLTDTHFGAEFILNDNYNSNSSNANHAIPMILDIMKNTGARFIMFNGDLVNSTDGVDEEIHCNACFIDKFGEYKYRLYNCVGNHEYYTDINDQESGRPSLAALYGGLEKFNETQYGGRDAYNDYYFDNPIQKIRYFVISCGRDVDIENEQAEWIMQELTQVPAGYKIVVFGHAFLSDDLSAFRNQHLNIMEALDAVTARTSYEFNGNTYDYSNLSNVKVVCVLTGHTHKDGYLASEGGTLCICTTCDTYAGQGGGITRTKGTVNEQAFDVVQFDFTNKKIYCTRIGYGSDREFDYGT